jgi:lipopolysaccharide heptosyltransferase II
MVSVERLLVIKMSALGDIAKAIPTVDSIRVAYPHLRVGWVARGGFHDLLMGNPAIDELIVAGRSARDLARAARAARRFAPDVVLDMQGLLVSGLIARWSGARWRCTWDSARELSGVLTGNPIVPGPPTMNAVECLFGFAHVLGVRSVPLVAPQYLVRDAALSARAGELLAGSRAPLVGLHIGASEPNKAWPAEHWASLADMLAAGGASVVLLGGPGDVAAGRAVEARMTRVALSLVGRTTIRELAAVVAQCSLFVGGDSGATHIAALVHTPVVCLMGPTSPARTAPYGHGHAVVHLGLSCSPCFRRPTCGGLFSCMRDLEPSRVAQACHRSLVGEARCA